MRILQCMLCSFSDEKSILSHIKNAHGLSAKTYRQRFPHARTRISWMQDNERAKAAFKQVGHANSARMKGSAGRNKLDAHQWSKKHAACVSCGTTSSRHFALGMCKTCYSTHAAMDATERNNLEIQKVGRNGVDYVTCLECGKPFLLISERGHLSTHNMTAKEYLTKHHNARLMPKKLELARNQNISDGRKRLMAERGYLNPPSQRAHKRTEMLSKLSSGKIAKVSKPEDVVAQWFVDHGCSVQNYEQSYTSSLVYRQFPVLGKYLVDFAIPSKKIVIEVWGDFWHAYDYHAGTKTFEALSEPAKKNVCGDEDRKRELGESGWTMLTIWEREVGSIQMEQMLLPLITDITEAEQPPESVSAQSIANSPRRLFNLRWLAGQHGITILTGLKVSKTDFDFLQPLLESMGEQRAIPDSTLRDLFNQCRQSGFPYYHLTQEQMQKRWQALDGCALPIKIDGVLAWDGQGTDLASIFHPHMFECRKKGKLSPIEFFNNDELLMEGIYKVLCLYGTATSSKIREICRNDFHSSRINNFPPKICVAIAKTLFGDKFSEIDVLDPCAGFGGRMLGFAATRVRTYSCIDLSSKTYAGLCSEREFLRNIGSTTDLQIQNGDCTLVMKDMLSERFDLAMTSPPFFNMEEYVGVPIPVQRDEWTKAFVLPFMTEVYRLLRHGGFMALYVGMGSKTIGLPELFDEEAKKVGFVTENPIRFATSNSEIGRRKTSMRETCVQVWRKP